eukprot:1564118-Alexandrium_andersonii.AAC.1
MHTFGRQALLAQEWQTASAIPKRFIRWQLQFWAALLFLPGPAGPLLAPSSGRACESLAGARRSRAAKQSRTPAATIRTWPRLELQRAAMIATPASAQTRSTERSRGSFSAVACNASNYGAETRHAHRRRDDVKLLGCPQRDDIRGTTSHSAL